MATLKRRYYIWLFKAYFKKMRRTIISSIILGILIFFAIIGLLNYYFRPLLFKPTKNEGYIGTFTIKNLPSVILNDISFGLTKVDQRGNVLPAASLRWVIKDERNYIFKIRPKTYFHNHEELTSDNIGYKFENVISKKIDKYTISYTLKNPYSPFLTAVSRPIFSKNLRGIGRYKVGDIDINGGFVRSLTLIDTNDRDKKRKLFFYPTEKALKVAFMLGEVDLASGLSSAKQDNLDISKWKKVEMETFTDYSTLVAVFYNNNDSVLSNKTVRQALNYSLPAVVEFGQRAYGPIPPTSIYFSKLPNYEISDIELSKTLLATVKEPINEPIVISINEEYEKVALNVQKAWEKIGVKTKIKIVQDIPSDFQVLIYKVKLPIDPDQYVLWHSDQSNNITRYKHQRIDKLLEDGRSITNVSDRQEIYADFQKYLVADVPASFFYFPTEYNLHKL